MKWRKPELVRINTVDLICNIKANARSLCSYDFINEPICTGTDYVNEATCPELDTGSTLCGAVEGNDGPIVGCTVLGECIEVAPLFGCHDALACSTLGPIFK